MIFQSKDIASLHLLLQFPVFRTQFFPECFPDSPRVSFILFRFLWLSQDFQYLGKQIGICSQKRSIHYIHSKKR